MSPASAPRVAVVHDWLTGMRGGERVLEQILALLPEAPVFTLFHVPGSVSEAIESHPIHTSPLQRAPFLRRHYRRYLPFFPAAVESFDLSPFDLVVSTSHCVAKGALPDPGAHHLCYCHTPMRYAWDQRRVYFRRQTGLVARLRDLVLSRLRVWDVASAARVDRFVANSHFVASRIRRYYGRSSDVVPPPVDTEYFTPDGGDREDFLLVVAALAPYKRLEVAIEAARLSGRRLLIAGDGPERERLQRLGDRCVTLLGRVSKARLRELYRQAACFLQPGVEDFGITTVEALACGLPVVALGRGGVCDIVRNGREGILFEEADSGAAMAAAVDKAAKTEFNILDLRARAEEFGYAGFRERFRALLAEFHPGLEGVTS